jgi:flavorubredoxin
MDRRYHMGAIEVRNGIHWVGAVDWAVRDFHGYITPKGSTYNNYLIMDTEPALVDAVHHEIVDYSIEKIRTVLPDLSKVRHLIVNHIEPDHAGGLFEFVTLMPKATIYCTKKAVEAMERMFDISGWNIKQVKTGDTVSTGSKTLVFLETPMLHWPDSMMTYVKEDKVLISQDGFGQHLASAQRFDDEFVDCTGMSALEDAVWDYYANILMPFGSLITRKLAEVKDLGLEIDIIAPDHGVIWRSHPDKVLQMYSDMAAGKCMERVSVIYDTMWHSTERMIEPLVAGLREESMDTKVIKLRATPASVAVKEFWRSRGTLIGSPTLNNTIFPPVGDFMFMLKGLRPRNRIVSAFGSFGWGGGAVKEILSMCEALKLEVMEPGIGFKYKATPEEEEKCYEYGREFARRTREYHKKF